MCVVQLERRIGPLLCSHEDNFIAKAGNLKDRFIPKISCLWLSRDKSVFRYSRYLYDSEMFSSEWKFLLNLF